jgi:hypothetical protein
MKQKSEEDYYPFAGFLLPHISNAEFWVEREYAEVVHLRIHDRLQSGRERFRIQFSDGGSDPEERMKNWKNPDCDSIKLTGAHSSGYLIYTPGKADPSGRVQGLGVFRVSEGERYKDCISALWFDPDLKAEDAVLLPEIQELFTGLRLEKQE